MEKAESFQVLREICGFDFVSLLDLLEKIQKEMLVLIC